MTPVYRPPRRGCVRGCVGCLFHHPMTVLLTGIALLFWLAQLVMAGIAFATARPLPAGPLVGTTLLVVLAQLGPRLLTVFWRRWRSRQAEAAGAPPSLRWWHWRFFALDSIGRWSRADWWRVSARRAADPTLLTRRPGWPAGDGNGVDGQAVRWRDRPDALWTVDADEAAYRAGDDPAAGSVSGGQVGPPFSAAGLAILRALAAERRLVIIDPSADPPFRPRVEDHPDA